MRKILNQLSYGRSLGSIGWNVFRGSDIRGSSYSEFFEVCRREIGSELGGGWLNRLEYFYIIPFCSYSSLRVEHVVYMDCDFRIYRDRSDPFPFNIHLVNGEVSRLYISCSWEGYFRYLSSRPNGVLGFNEVCIVLDSAVSRGEWIDRLRGLAIVVIDNGDDDSVEYVKRLLKLERLSYSELSMVVEEDSYLGKRELVSELRKLGVETTYDTIRKVIRFFEVPCRGDSFSLRFFQIYFKYKDSGLSRGDSCSRALVEYRDKRLDRVC